MRKFSIGALCMALFGCAQPAVEAYKDTTPRFDIQEYFAGEHVGWGMLRDWSGKVTRRFTFTMKGTVDGDKLRLDEAFEFDDGEKQTRVWNITMKDENHFTGTASDGVGTATGKQFGSVVNMQYDLNVKTDSGEMVVGFDDWLFLQPDGVVLNETYLKKFGLTVGRLTIVIKKK